MKTSGHKLLFFTLLLPTLTSLFLALTSFASPDERPKDEQLLFSTYLGGQLSDGGAGIAVDKFGSSYITGNTQSIIFPAPTASLAAEHGVDVFVAKISPDGDQLIYLLWFNALSAADVDEGLGIAVDKSGYAYISGHTRSADFCSLFGEVPGYDTTYNEDGDAFLLKVKQDGSGLVYCTFLGGSDWDSGSAVIVDDDGKATITGGTWSTDFPTTANAAGLNNKGQRDAFVTTIDPSGTILLYSSYMGGSNQEEGRALTKVGPNQVAISGWTNSADFPTTTGSFDPSYNGAFDAFLAQIDFSSGTQTYGSFLGSAGEDRATGLTTIDDEQLLVTGYVAATEDSPSPSFPTTPGAISQNLRGESDAFVVKFNSQGSGLAYSTLIGGGGSEQGLAVSASDQAGFALTGYTTSIDFPTTAQAYQPQYSDLHKGPDAFITQFDASGSHLLYSSYLGGDHEDSGHALMLMGSDQVYLTGTTRSANFPISPTAPYPANAGDYDAFITKLALVQSPVHQLHLPLVLVD